MAEQVQDGSNLPGNPNPASQLIVLAPAVPEPASPGVMLAGLALVGCRAARRVPTRRPGASTLAI